MSAKPSRSLFAYAVVYLIFLYAPVILLPLFAFNDSAIIALPLSGFTLHWFGLLWETRALHEALYNSLLIAVIVVQRSIDGKAVARDPGFPIVNKTIGHQGEIAIRDSSMSDEVLRRGSRRICWPPNCWACWH